MIYYLFILVLFFTLHASEGISARIPVYGDVVEGAFFKRVVEEELCRHRKIVVHGVRNYIRVKNLCNQEQIKIVTGILYIQEFYSPDHIYVSPLPSSQTLKKHGRRFHVVYSRPLSFYIESLRKDLHIIPIMVSSPFELDTVLPKIFQEAEIFVLLPDPVFYDAKGFAILRYWLKRHTHMKILDIANLNIEHPNTIKINLEKKKYFLTIREIYSRDDVARGVIYYVDY